MATKSRGQYIFEIKDWIGRTVRLTRHTLNAHKERHPEFVPYLGEAQQTIQDPDFIAKTDSNAFALFRFGLGKNLYKNLYLVVIVHYNENGGTVATHYFTSRIGDLKIVKIRHQWVSGLRYP